MASEHLQSAPVILIVDDDEAIRDMLQLLLEDEGYRVLQARDGIEALAMALVQGIDAILLDLAMPRLTGEAFCRAYRERGGTARVVLMTASVLQGNSVDALKREATVITEALTQLVEVRQQQVQAQLQELSTKISALSGELHEVRHESSLDGLTRAFNRGAFDRTMHRVQQLNVTFGQRATFILIDIDHFKSINDTYDHSGGDAAFKSFADCLAPSFPRRSDCIARYGGDEFAVILPDTPLEQATRLADRFIQCVHQLTVGHHNQTFSLTTSVGLAELSRSESVESWLERADAALYQAKQAGRD